MKTVELTIDGKTVTARAGERLLWAALEAGIFIPHLCADKELEFHPASCRLCWVEVEGRDRPVTACTVMVEPGLTVRTRSEAVDRLVRTGFALLMSTHRLDCKVCPANRHCALQEIAKKRKLPLRPRGLEKIEPDWPVDDSHSEFGLNPNRCVLCGKCVHVCNRIVKSRTLDFCCRGLATVVGTFDGRPLGDQDCHGCVQCVSVCPVGALYLKPRDRKGEEP